MTSKTNIIIDALVAGLATITGVTTKHGTVNLDVNKVRHGARIGYGEPPTSFPLVDVIQMSNQTNFNPAENVDQQLTLRISGQVRGVDMDGANELEAAIRNYLGDNPELGGVVTVAWPTSATHDGGTWENSAFDLTVVVLHQYDLGSA